LNKLIQEVFHQLKGDAVSRDILVSRKENFTSLNETLIVSELGWTYKSKLDNTSKAVFGSRTLIGKKILEICYESSKSKYTYSKAAITWNKSINYVNARIIT